jgi:hypothetical protein
VKKASTDTKYCALESLVGEAHNAQYRNVVDGTLSGT